MVVSQFCSDEAVNGLLNYGKRVVDQACCKYERPSELKTIQYLVFAGMVSYYGFEHIDEITKAFRDNKFYYTKKSVIDFMQEHVGSKSALDCLTPDTMAYSYQNYFHNRTKNQYYAECMIVVSDQKQCAPDRLLENTTHEINHAVNSVVKKITPVGGSFKSRMGLYERDFRDGSRKNIMLEESFNTLQSAEIMDHILEFTNYRVDDPEIKYALDSIKYAAGKKRMGLGYVKVTPVVRPLYENSRFNGILRDRRLDGNIDVVRDEFDAKVGVGSFYRLDTLCGEVFRSSPGIFNTSKSSADDLVKQYVKK